MFFFYLLVNGNWGNWTEFTNCSSTCGFGNEIRKRYCDSPSPEFNGTDCPGVDIDIKTGCNPYPCPGITYITSV